MIKKNLKQLLILLYFASAMVSTASFMVMIYENLYADNNSGISTVVLFVSVLIHLVAFTILLRKYGK